MLKTEVIDSAPADAGTSKPRRRRRWPARLVIVLLVLVGVTVTSWPVALTFVHNYQHTEVAVQIEDAVQAATHADLREALAAAHRYNDQLSPDVLRDPWTERGAAGTADQAKYLQELALFPAMGTLTVPSINLHLPIYHNASDQTMVDGVGHFFGTSLPVGGKGTHAVLAGHSGMSYATLFDRLPEVQVGDTFQIQVYGKLLTYRVDQITQVLPDQFKRIQPVPGHDYVTLMTCVPRLVNTFRLLVRGERIPNPPEQVQTTTSSTPATHTTDFSVQQWMVPRVAISAVALGCLVLITLGWLAGDVVRRRRRERLSPG